MFLSSGDTLLYYYLLNDKAFELAELGKKEECLHLLATIESQSKYSQIQTKTWETRAELFNIMTQYDSAIYCAQRSILLGNSDPTCIIIKAQAFSQMEIGDSALFYANIVLTHPYASYQNRFNALYVISHYDSTLCAEDIRSIASQREDIRYYEYEPEKEKLTDAIDLLLQDIEHKSDKRWIYVLVATLLFILSCSMMYYIWCRRKQHHNMIIELQEKKIERGKLEKNINNLALIQESKRQQLIDEIESVCDQFRNNRDMKADLCWNDYETMCTIINRRMFGILDRLRSYSLSEKETRLCVLILLKANTEQMVDLIPYARSGLGKFKYTTARKLSTTTSNMRPFLLNLIH